MVVALKGGNSTRKTIADAIEIFVKRAEDMVQLIVSLNIFPFGSGQCAVYCLHRAAQNVRVLTVLHPDLFVLVQCGGKSPSIIQSTVQVCTGELFSKVTSEEKKYVAEPGISPVFTIVSFFLFGNQYSN